MYLEARIGTIESDINRLKMQVHSKADGEDITRVKHTLEASIAHLAGEVSNLRYTVEQHHRDFDERLTQLLSDFNDYKEKHRDHHNPP